MAALLLLAVAFVAHPDRIVAEQADGGVYVTTLPSGADIWIDGTYVGRAPVLLDALVPGHHSLTITKTGWVVQEVDVTVTPGTTLFSNTRLAAGPHALAGNASGSLVLRGVPAGAVLELDGDPLTVSAGQSASVPAGRHRLTSTTARGKVTRSLTVLPDMVTEVVLAEPKTDEAKSAVVAPAEDYLPTNNFSLEGKKVVVHYAGHTVVCFLGDREVKVDGTSTSYDGAPESIDGKLYLPLALLEKLAEDMSNAR